MPPVQQFDVIVIGAGPGGVAAADTASLMGKRVALVEKNPAVGGAAVGQLAVTDVDAGQHRMAGAHAELAGFAPQGCLVVDAQHRAVGARKGQQEARQPLRPRPRR